MVLMQHPAGVYITNTEVKNGPHINMCEEKCANVNEKQSKFDAVLLPISDYFSLNLRKVKCPNIKNLINVK